MAKSEDKDTTPPKEENSTETATNDAKRELPHDDTAPEQQLKQRKADRKDEPDDTVDARSAASTDSEDDEDNDDPEQEKVTTSMTKTVCSRFMRTLRFLSSIKFAWSVIF